VVSRQKLAAEANQRTGHILGDGSGVGLRGGIKSNTPLSEGFYGKVFYARAGPNKNLQMRSLRQQRLVYGYSPSQDPYVCLAQGLGKPAKVRARQVEHLQIRSAL